MSRGERDDRAIWGGSRVWINVPGIPDLEGVEGRNLGKRRIEDGETTLAILLDDGREVRVPLPFIKKAEKKFTMPDIVWKSDPRISAKNRKAYLVITEIRGEYRYSVEGSSGRWFISRYKEGEEDRAQRTRFFQNQKDAEKVFGVIVYG